MTCEHPKPGSASGLGRLADLSCLDSSGPSCNRGDKLIERFVCGRAAGQEGRWRADRGPRRRTGRRGRLTPLVVFALVAALGGCGGSRTAADDVTALVDAPLLAQPKLDVVATGLEQQGERLLMSAVVANRSKTLDAREAVVVLVAFDGEGRPLAERPRTLLSIPAASKVAVTASAVLEPRAVAARVTAHVGLPDAAVPRAADPLAAPAQDVQVRPEGDAVLVSGLVDDRLYPVPYSVDVVLSSRQPDRRERSGRVSPEQRRSDRSSSRAGRFRPASTFSRPPPSLRFCPRPTDASDHASACRRDRADAPVGALHRRL